MKEPVLHSESDLAEQFRLEEFLPYGLSVASDGVSRMIARRYLGQFGLGMPEWRLLAVVGRHGVLSPTEAGDRTSMDKVKVSRAAASLVGRGLLRQSRDPDDGRGRLMRLTRKGMTVYTSIAPTGEQIEKTLSACMTRSEWLALHKTLAKLINHTHSLLEQETATNRH
jgi:DNA-binding MarR family transcriptional regulator